MAKKKLQQPTGDYVEPQPPHHIYRMEGQRWICPRCGYVLGTAYPKKYPPCYFAPEKEIAEHRKIGLAIFSKMINSGEKLYETKH